MVELHALPFATTYPTLRTNYYHFAHVLETKFVIHSRVGATAELAGWEVASNGASMEATERSAVSV